MKLTPVLLAAALCCGLFTAGCSTTASGKKVVSVQKAQDIAPALAATVSGAVLYGQSKNPNAVAYAAVVKEALKEFILTPDLSPVRLQAAISALPIKELKTPEAQLLMTPILTSYKVFADQRVKAGLTDNEGLRVLIQAVIDGIDAAVDALNSMPTAHIDGRLLVPQGWDAPNYHTAYWEFSARIDAPYYCNFAPRW